jgi:hypothetical protein
MSSAAEQADASGRGKAPVAARTADELLTSAGLPDALEHLVGSVLKRTRLWPRERLDVAAELISHFQEGLEADADADTLAESFGDARRAARLIRRATKRKRPAWWRAYAMCLRSFIILICLLVAAYVVQTVRVFVGKPDIRTDYVAQLNEPIAAIPQQDRAWPIYEQAGAMLEDEPQYGMNREPRPGEKRWEILEFHIIAQAEALELARAAARKPAYGRELTTGFMDEPPMSNDPGRLDESLIGVLLPDLSVMRDIARQLRIDTWHAAANGDADRAVANVRAMIRMGDHTSEVRILISDLVRLSIWNYAIDLTLEVLHRYPDLWTDEQLVTLAHELAVLGGEDGISVSFDIEKMMIHDIIQRIYTDDGSGDGYLTASGVQALAGIADFGVVPSVLDEEVGQMALLPVMSAVVAGRKEMTARHEELWALMKRDASTPLWEMTFEADRAVDEMYQSRLNKLRYYPLSILMPAVGRAAVLPELLKQRRDGALVALAANIHRRRTGSWPASLDEMVPGLLPELPRDRYDGSVLRYALTPDGPVIYGIGPDMDDDGGRLPRTGSGRVLLDDVRRGPDARGVDGKPVDGDWVLYPPYLEPLELEFTDEEMAELQDWEDATN